MKDADILKRNIKIPVKTPVITERRMQVRILFLKLYNCNFFIVSLRFCIVELLYNISH